MWLVGASAVLCLLAAMTLMAGCGGLAEKAAEKAIERAASQGGDSVDVDINQGGVTIKGDQGQTEIQAGGKVSLPDGFPPELAYANGKLMSAVSTQNQGATSFGVIYSTSESVDAVYSYYLSALEKAGFTIENKMKAESDGGSSFTIQASNSSYSALVVGGSNQGENGETGFTIQLHQK